MSEFYVGTFVIENTEKGKIVNSVTYSLNIDYTKQCANFGKFFLRQSDKRTNLSKTRNGENDDGMVHGRRDEQTTTVRLHKSKTEMTARCSRKQIKTHFTKPFRVLYPVWNDFQTRSLRERA